MGSLPKKEIVQNEWDKLKRKEVQIERDRGSSIHRKECKEKHTT